MYVGMGIFPRPAWAKVASIHPYTTFNNSLFFKHVVWTLLSRNVCLVEEIEFQVFDETVDFSCMYVYFLGLHRDKDRNV